MNKLNLAVVTVIAVAGVAASLAIRHRAQSQLRDQNDSLRQQAEESARLSADNERLAQLAARVQSSSSLSRDELRELLMLRNEVGLLRQTATEKGPLQAGNAQLRATAEAAEKQLAAAQAAPNYWPRDQLRYAGYGDPESAMKSLLSAMNSGDAGSWRLSCTPEALAQLEKRWQARGLTPAQQEAEIKSMADMLISSSAGFHILDQKLTAPDEAVVDLSFDGEGKARKFVLRKVGNEWKFHNLMVAGQEVAAEVK